MGPMMVAAGWKLLGQTLFIAAGIICLKMGEKTVADALIFGAIGSLVPLAEKHAHGPKASKDDPS